MAEKLTPLSDLSIFPKTTAVLMQLTREALLDHDAFERPLPVCELATCKGMCCHDGVILSAEEARVLAEEGGGEGVVFHEGKWRTQLKEASPELLVEEVYPAHFPSSRCVFLDENHHCHWQKRAREEGKHPWFYKPTSCWLHPLLFEQRGERVVLTLRSPEDDRAGFATETTCGKLGCGAQTARAALQAELQMLSELGGRDLGGELDAPTVPEYR